MLVKVPQEARWRERGYTPAVPRLLITGASGYVGGRVVEAAPAEWEVHGHWRTRQPPPRAVAHQADLADAAAVARVTRAAEPELVLHAAYQMAAPAEQNMLWSRNVFAAAREVGARVLLMSTDLVFDGQRGWYREDEPPSPSIPYGAWKAELEREALDLGAIVVRTSLVWGLDPPNDSVRQLVLQPIERGETPRLFDDEWRTPTEVHDLAAALVRACTVAEPCVLHFAGPERISRYDLGRLIARHFGHDPSAWPPYKRAEIAPARPADTSLAITDLTRSRVDAPFRGPSELLSG
jgi:dTDP-4-dehydrorhamnose reductase